jgi:GrpB-like predicted nucleotidyltransferase (UPF0157 family)
VDEEELRAVTVGELKQHDAPITLEESNPAWPEWFAREGERIRRILGDRVIALEHVGSTSVPGLTAKPIIDMVLVVSDSRDEASYISPLEAEGYRLRLREPDWYEHRLLKGPDTNVNLHVFSSGCEEVDRMVAFRDHLRSSEQDCALYERTKRDLAKREWKYVQYYADAKSAVVADIMSRA